MTVFLDLELELLSFSVNGERLGDPIQGSPDFSSASFFGKNQLSPPCWHGRLAGMQSAMWGSLTARVM